MHALYLEVRDTEMGISMEDRARKRDRAHQRREREQHEAEVAAALEQQRQQEEWRQQNQEAEVAAALEQQRQQEEWQQRNQEAEVAAAFEHQQQREAEVVAAFEHQRQQEEWQQQALQQQQQQQEQEYLQQRQLVLVPDARTSHRHLSPNAKLAKKLAEKKDDLVLDAKANTSSKRTDKIMQKRLEQQGPDLNVTFSCAYDVDLWCEGKKILSITAKGNARHSFRFGAKVSFTGGGKIYEEYTVPRALGVEKFHIILPVNNSIVETAMYPPSRPRPTTRSSSKRT